MPAKRRSRVFVVGFFVLVGSIILVRWWLPSGNAPQQPGSKTKSVQPTDDTRKSPKPSSLSKKLDYETGQELGSAESLKSTTQPRRTAVAKTPETLGDPVLDGLVRDTEDQEWKLRWDAVNELGKLKDPRAIPALVNRVLYDDNAHPRWRSLWALKTVDQTGSEVIPLLRAALLDPDEVVVRNAAVGLAFFSQAEARSELLKGLDDRDSFRRWEAIFSLQGIGNYEVAQALVPLLEEDTEPEVRVRNQVALALAYTGGQEVIFPLVNALRTDKSPKVRWRAALSLSQVGNSSIIEELENIMRTEQDPQVRKHIKGALTAIKRR